MTGTRAALLPRVGGDKALAALLVAMAHAALLVAWRQQAGPGDSRESPRIDVRLLPLPAIGEPPPPGTAAPVQRRQAARPARPAAGQLPPVQAAGPAASPTPVGEPVKDEGTSKLAGPRLGDAARAAAIASPSLAERARAQLPAAPGDTLQRGIAGAARPDCKDAYSDLVLLAIPMLVIDTVRDRGCRWK